MASPMPEVEPVTRATGCSVGIDRVRSFWGIAFVSLEKKSGSLLSWAMVR